MSAFCGGPHEKSNVDQRLNKQNNQLEGFLNGAFLLLLYTSAPINPFFLAWMICCVRAMEIITQNTKQEGSEMSGAQMAHFLKQVGNGSELEGIVTVYRTGWLVGAGQLVTVVIAAHGVFRLGKWGYEKLVDYLQERGYIVAAGEVG